LAKVLTAAQTVTELHQYADTLDKSLVKFFNWRSSVFSFLSNLSESAVFGSAKTMAPQLDAAEHILIETLLKQGFENKLIASEASCSVRTV
jgi:hypothetical protein